MNNPNIISIEGKTPQIGDDTYVAPTAAIVGEVITGNGCSIWFSAVLRGDVAPITLGNNVNVQDGAVLHGTYGKAPVVIGNDVTIGHNATVHGCTIGDNVLIGMGSTILDGAIITSNTIIAAGALVLANTVTEPNSIYAGVPAKKVKDLDPDVAHERIAHYATNYAMYKKWYE
ncbi:MAG: gamma carbonic anhydrase family protein [Bacteroidales bacterium]|jgi:carbonic anhydrase/acetyltransferase-like protein (isoleucine patch superfamily)|nr:gamma carbonic anhydrase family protein [Bacteroidales bacterium]MBP5419793.1 gamma carbonic anhydrase family protein [Bacteroidales bacterium]MCR5695666.1 gamma carbonic anhydrase family protein [Marinilabiliaceae bacterium]